MKEPGSPVIIRVPFFLILGCNKETPKQKGQKGTAGEPSKGTLTQTEKGLRVHVLKQYMGSSLN